MSLTQEQIKKISEKLSKIPSSANLEKDLNNILSYFELLKEVDTENVEPTYSVIKKDPNILREDVIKKDELSTPRELLECSPEQIIANQIAISNIMNH